MAYVRFVRVCRQVLQSNLEVLELTCHSVFVCCRCSSEGVVHRLGHMIEENTKTLLDGEGLFVDLVEFLEELKESLEVVDVLHLGAW